MQQESCDQREAQCLRYAEQLAVRLAAKWYPDVRFNPLSGDLLGLLMQIDNMTTGMVREGARE